MTENRTPIVEYRHVGNRSPAEVHVFEDDEDQGELDPCYEQRRHSPDGFEFGYQGSGPAQLALALLNHATDEETAQRHYRDFTTEVVNQFEPGWRITRHYVREWVQKHEGPRVNRDA